jgi:uncharacterized protein YbjQ (UPF0145 family)
MKTSSGDIPESYEVIGIISGFASTTPEGCGSISFDVPKAYSKALESLQMSANSRGADAVIFVNFQNRIGVAPSCSGGSQSLEVFAWGTAVKFNSNTIGYAAQ